MAARPAQRTTVQVAGGARGGAGGAVARHTTSGGAKPRETSRRDATTTPAVGEVADLSLDDEVAGGFNPYSAEKRSSELPKLSEAGVGPQLNVVVATASTLKVVTAAVDSEPDQDNADDEEDDDDNKTAAADSGETCSSVDNLLLQIDILKKEYGMLLEHSRELDQQRVKAVHQLEAFKAKYRLFLPADELVDGTPAASAPPPFRGMGWLTKQGGVVKSWKRRWFRTEESAIGLTLKYTESPDAIKVLGVIPLRTVTKIDTGPPDRSSSSSSSPPPPTGSSADCLFSLSTVAGRTYHLLASSAADRQQWVAFVQEAMVSSGIDESGRLIRLDGVDEEPAVEQPKKTYEELLDDCSMLRREYSSLLRSTKEIESDRLAAAEALLQCQAAVARLERDVHTRDTSLDSFNQLVDGFRNQIAALTAEREDHIQRIRRALITEASQEDALRDLKERAAVALSDMAGTSAPDVLVQRMLVFGTDCLTVPLHHVRSLEQKRQLLRAAERTQSPNIIMYVLLFIESHLTRPTFYAELVGFSTNTVAMYRTYLAKTQRHAELHQLQAYLYRAGSLSDLDWSLHLLRCITVAHFDDQQRIRFYEELAAMPVTDVLLVGAIQSLRRYLPLSYLKSVVAAPPPSSPSRAAEPPAATAQTGFPAIEPLPIDPSSIPTPKKRASTFKSMFSFDREKR